MPSPLKDFYNTILIIPTGQTMGTDDVGNPVLISGTEVEYKAYLKKATKDPNVSYQTGVNSSKQYFTGYVVEPEALPQGLNLPATVKCRKRRGQNDIWIEGKFEILAEFLPIDIVEDVLGDYISGYFFLGK